MDKNYIKLSTGVVCYENLCNLKSIPSKFKVYCFPLKIEGIDALPTRILVEF
ncbi:MAG: hypothetical protein ACRDDL_01955 [Sarcina sp.]